MSSDARRRPLRTTSDEQRGSPATVAWEQEPRMCSKAAIGAQKDRLFLPPRSSSRSPRHPTACLSVKRYGSPHPPTHPLSSFVLGD